MSKYHNKKSQTIDAEKELPLQKLPDIVKSLGKKSKKNVEHQSYLYLYAAMNKPNVTNLIRSYCKQEEIIDLPNTISAWEQARATLESIVRQEPGMADNVQTYDIGPNQKIDNLQNNALFKNTFSNTPIEIKMVDIDTLVAVQRNVYLDYINEIEDRIQDKPSIDELIDVCLPLESNSPEPKVTQTNPTSWIFSSPSTDFRFLGGYLKEQLTEDDLQYTQVSGFPVKVITLFVGYGGSPINVYEANNRLVLANGFHRVYALRRKGITRIPVVIQKVANPQLEFPPQILGFTREYLLYDPRPILVKDFFTPGLSRKFKRKKMITTVQVTATGGPITFEV